MREFSASSVLLRILGMCAGLVADSVSALRFIDPDFHSESLAVMEGSQPVGLALAPDGRIFVWQKGGRVVIVKDGALLPRPFIDIGDHVNQAHDRGLLGLALDPDFASNGFVYLLYTFEPGTDREYPGPRSGRLTRVRADPSDPDRALPDSETILLGKLAGPCSQYPSGSDCIATDHDSHGVGTLLFGPDGKLLISIGDGSSYTEPDSLSFRAQDLDRYEGKILRVEPDGSAPGDNPFDDGTQSIRSKVYAYGLRNPFRFGLDASGEPCIGDVGSNRFEEIDRGRGANFGWPCWEGMSPNWHQVEILGAANCAKLDSTAAVTTKPVFAYGREFGNSVIGGDFNRGTAFPEAMRGDFFFGDYATGKLWRLRLDSAGHALGAEVFAEEMGGPVCLRFGPDGCLYYVAYSAQGTSVIRRIGYAGTTRVGTHAAGRGRDGLRDPLAPLYDGIGRIRGRKDASRKVPIPPPGRSGTPVFPGK